MRITVMGMGNMGRAIATRLCRTGHDVVVWNRTPGRAAAVLEEGATEAATVAGAVLGAPRAVSDGSASYLVAGPRSSIDRLAPMGDTLSASWRVLGDDPGMATTWKALSNTLLMAGVSVVAEVVVTAQRAGIADDLLTDLLTTSPMVAPGLHNRIGNIVGDIHDGWFSGRLGAKDLRLTEELAAGCGLTLPVTASVRQRYEAMIEAGIDGDDIAAVVELVRRS